MLADAVDDVREHGGKRRRIDRSSVAYVGLERVSRSRQRLCADDAGGAFHPMQRRCSRRRVLLLQ